MGTEGGGGFWVPRFLGKNEGGIFQKAGLRTPYNTVIWPKRN